MRTIRKRQPGPRNGFHRRLGRTINLTWNYIKSSLDPVDTGNVAAGHTSCIEVSQPGLEGRCRRAPILLFYFCLGIFDFGLRLRYSRYAVVRSIKNRQLKIEISPMLQAIVFDFDGVIADSEPIHYQAFLRLSEERWGYAFSWETYLQRYVGYDDRDALRTLLQDAAQPAVDEASLQQLIDRKGDYFEEVVNAGVRTFPGTVEFIRHAAGTLPVAIASGATRRDIDLIVQRLGLGGVFDIIVTADVVHHSKPDPQTYELAVQRLTRKHPELNLQPTRCLAIEDTPAGIASARAAGLPVLALTTSTPAAQLNHAQRVVANLQGLTVAQLQQWFD